MLPVLFSWGPIVIRTLNVVLIFAFLSGAFVFWRKGREEHYDEFTLFDGFLLSTLFGLLVGRIGFIITHFSFFQFDVLKWFNIFQAPGFSLGMVFVAASWYMYKFAIRQKWDAYEVLDFWIMGVCLSLVWIWVGFFLEGTGFGQPTSLPWGITFPGVFTRNHPVQLYLVACFILLFWYLSWVEFRYRTFAWYRAGKSTAQTGFLLSMFLLISGLVTLLMSMVMIPSWQISGWRMDIPMSFLTMVAGGWLLYHRSGRTISLFKKR